MSKATLLAPLLVLSIATCQAQATRRDGDCVEIAAVVALQGSQPMTPRLLAHFDQTASLQVNDSIRLEVTAHDQGSTAELKMALFRNTDGGLKKVGEPKMVLKYGAEAKMSVVSSGSGGYSIEALATRSECKARVPPSI